MFYFELVSISKLARSWEAYEVDRELWEEDAQYDEVVITREDLKVIFDGQGNTILKLVKDQLALALRSMMISMYFGRTQIQVSAEPMNFGGGKKSMFKVSFERDLVEFAL
ncbi:unnamed protein product [Calypogeia fissa]